MKFLASQTTLSEALQATSYFAPTKSLGGTPTAVHMTAEEGQLTISCSDFGHLFRCQVPGEVLQDGEVLVPYRIFSEVVRRLPPGSVLLSLDEGGGSFTISWGNSSYNLNVLSPGSSAMEDAEEPASSASTVQLTSAQFRRIVASTAFAASSDLAREIMTGVCISWEGEWLSMAAIDGVRLAHNRTKVQSTSPKDVCAVVPARILNDVGRLAGEKGGVDVQFEEKRVRFSMGNYRVTSRVLEGKFPDYREILKVHGGTSVRVDRASFIAALERVSLFSKDTDRAVVIDLDREKVTLGSRSQEVGSAREELPATVTGDLIRVSFNARYLIEGMNVVDEDGGVILTLTGLASKALITVPDSDEWSEYTYVLMPLRME